VKTLHVVRHGQASWLADDYDELTDLGRRQARVAGSALAQRGIEPQLVVSGALERHRDTARLAIEEAGWSFDPQVDDRWAEFDHVDLVARFDPAYPTHGHLARAMGEADGHERVSRLMLGAMTAWVEDTGDGGFTETFEQFCTRVYAAADDVVAQLDEDGIAVVFTSGGPIGALALRALAGSADQWIRLAISANGAVSTFVELEEGTGPVLSTLNDFSYLDLADLVTFAARHEPRRRPATPDRA
jgi:broad specificity phosphatase PhoE